MKTQITTKTKYFNYRAVLVTAVLLIFCLVNLTQHAYADTLISQGYTTSSSIAEGSIVSLQKNSSDSVNPTTISTSSDIIGVVINNNNSQVSISTGSTNQVQVATNGVQQVLVSNVNGDISVGDAITASPVAGVGMKASSNTKVVGIAQSAFPNSTATKQNYKNNGQSSTITIGTVPVIINVAYYFKQPNKTIIPAAVQNLANALAGKTVNPLPIIISIGIFFITLIIVVSIIYAMIKNSIISVGRNPLAQSAVYRNVIQMSILVVIILGVAILSIVMVLTKF